MTSSPSGFCRNPEIKQLFPESRNHWAARILAGSNVVVFSCRGEKMYILFPDEKSKILSEEGPAGLPLVISLAREPSPRIACVNFKLGTAVPSRCRAKSCSTTVYGTTLAGRSSAFKTRWWMRIAFTASAITAAQKMNRIVRLLRIPKARMSMILSGRVAFLDCAQAPQHPKVPNWERERFDRGLRFRAILQAMSDGISSEIRRLFDDLLQIGIAHAATLKEHPVEALRVPLPITSVRLLGHAVNSDKSGNPTSPQSKRLRSGCRL
jgi:hypothetical protein